MDPYHSAHFLELERGLPYIATLDNNSFVVFSVPIYVVVYLHAPFELLYLLYYFTGVEIHCIIGDLSGYAINISLKSFDLSWHLDTIVVCILPFEFF